MLVNNRMTRRPGFTLIELLIVIAIIALLLGLLLSAVFGVLDVRARTETTENLKGLSTALEKFKAEYGIYPPSRILLSPNASDYSATPLGITSRKYLYKIWPKLDMDDVSWKALVKEELEGDQCLVFFLGGLPSVNPTTNPTENILKGFSQGDVETPLSDSGPRLKFYDFKLSRLYLHTGKNYYSYKDAYDPGVPYAYFSHGLRKNGYSDNDCSTLGIVPFYSSTSPVKQYLRPDGFQIISAGKDGQFGSVSGPFLANQGMQSPPAIKDNQANFHGLKLGIGN